MKALNLAKVAGRAELLRLKGLAARQVRRVAYGAGALLFMIGALLLGHVAAWQVLVRYVGTVWATVILLGIDLLIAILLGMLAARSQPSTLEVEAETIRRRALIEARTTIVIGTLIPVVWRLIAAYRRRTPSQRTLK
jgi:hypothetical protein